MLTDITKIKKCGCQYNKSSGSKYQMFTIWDELFLNKNTFLELSTTSFISGLLLYSQSNTDDFSGLET